MPQCRITEFGNVNVQTRVLSRVAASTHVVTEDPASTSGKTMTRAEYDRIAALQDEYIAERDMVVIDGYIGNDPDDPHRGAAHDREAPTPTSPGCSRSSTSRATPAASPRCT